MSVLTLRFHLAPSERRTIRRALRAARSLCDHPSSMSPGTLLELISIDFRAGGPIYCTERAPGLRESYRLRLHPERLEHIEAALHAARLAGAPDDSTALLWVVRTFLYHRASNAAVSAAAEQRGTRPARGASWPSGREPEGPEEAAVAAEVSVVTGPTRLPHPLHHVHDPLLPFHQQCCFPRRLRHGNAPHRADRPGAQHPTSKQVPQGPPSASRRSTAPQGDGGGEATFAELDRDWLRRFSTRVDGMYRPGWVPKRDGRGTRAILMPDVILKAFQRWVLDELLAPAVDTPIGFGHSRERDVFAAARVHSRRRPRVLAVVDIENFFPSVTVGRVEQALHHAGIEPELVEVLALICTRGGTLVQGAPTSPAVASLILGDVDRRVADFAKAHSCIAARYCDDWGVSGDDRAAVERVVAFIAQEVERVGLKLHPRKSRIMDRRSPMVCLGLNVADPKLSIPPTYRARLDSEVHRAALHGADAETLGRLLGEAGYVSRLHPREGDKMFKRLRGAPLKQETTVMEKKNYCMDPDKRGMVELVEPREPGAGTSILPDGRSVTTFVEDEAGRMKGLTMHLEWDLSGELSPFTDPLPDDEDGDDVG